MNWGLHKRHLLMGYQAKSDDKQQGEGVGHKMWKMGPRHLWMPHKDKYEKYHIESIVELPINSNSTSKRRWNHCVSTIKWFLCKLTGIFLTEPKTLLLLQETKLHSSKVYLYLMFYFLPKKVISPSQQHNVGDTFFHDHHVL